MKTIISKNKKVAISDFEKKISSECSKWTNLAVDPAILIQQLDMQNNFALVCGWFYLLGIQRYQGNHSAQDFHSFIRRGIARFIRVLAAYNINKAVQKPLFGDEACSVWIEKKNYDKFFSTVVNVFQGDIVAWGAALDQMGYAIFQDIR